ncbi:unnamed protein product, partial [Heterobilharzia americana]
TIQFTRETLQPTGDNPVVGYIRHPYIRQPQLERTDYLFVSITIVEVTTGQLVDNGSVDHNNLVYNLQEGEQLPPLATTEPEGFDSSQDSDKSDTVIVEPSKNAADDNPSHFNRVEAELRKETEFHRIQIPEDEAALLSDNDLPSPPLSLCQESQLGTVEDCLSAFPLTPSRDSECHLDSTEHIVDEVAGSDLLPTDQVETIPSYCLEVETEQKPREFSDKGRDFILDQPSNSPSSKSFGFTEDCGKKEFIVEDLGQDLRTLVHTIPEDTLSGISEIKEAPVPFNPNKQASQPFVLEEELTESPDLKEALIDSSNVEEEVTVSFDLEKEVCGSLHVQKKVTRSTDIQAETIDSSNFEKGIPDSTESPTILNSQSQLSFTEYHVTANPEYTTVSQLSDKKDSSNFYTDSTVPATLIDLSNHLPENTYRDSIISSESVPSKHSSTPTNSIGESVNCTTIDNNTNKTLKELTCDTSMGTTVGVSDIMADHSDIKELCTSYQYEAENTPSQSSLGHFGDMNEMPSHTEYRTSLDEADDDLSVDVKGTNENPGYHANEDEEDDVANDQSEYTNLKTEESYGTFVSNPSQLQQDTINNESVNKVIKKEVSNQSIKNITGGNNDCLKSKNDDGHPKMTFNQIREDLEKKNVVGSYNLYLLNNISCINRLGDSTTRDGGFKSTDWRSVK